MIKFFIHHITFHLLYEDGAEVKTPSSVLHIRKAGAGVMPASAFDYTKPRDI